MKYWTEEDLILLYYQELDPDLAQRLKQDMTASNDDSAALRTEYQALSEILDNEFPIKVPEPSSGFNLKIMASVNAAEAEKRQALYASQLSTVEKTTSFGQQVIHWLTGSPSNNLRPALMFVLFSSIGIFYLGRMTAPIEPPVTHLGTPSNTDLRYRSSEDASRRMLLSNVSSHIETSQRLLTLVINSDNDLHANLAPRRQMIDQLINFNRLYRRLAEQSNDAMLANVLQQMESVLLEINNTDSSDAEWEKVRERLDGTDLLFKLKVADKKINHELI